MAESTTLLIKPGVHIAGLRSEIVVAVLAAERVWEAAGHDLMITSGVEGRHMAGSLHYVAAAVDIRTNDIPAPDVAKPVARPAYAWAGNKVRVHGILAATSDRGGAYNEGKRGLAPASRSISML